MNNTSYTDSNSSQHRRICHFHGRVQGVGFRYTTQNLALQYDVNGYVKNLSDGSVELVIEGPDPELDHLVDALRQKMNGFIRKIDINDAPCTGEFCGFRVKH